MPKRRSDNKLYPERGGFTTNRYPEFMAPAHLLPVGFYDLLSDEAEKSHRKINLTLDFFLEGGYRLFKTPLLEFADNFSHQEITDSFLITDPISGKNLVLRNDITLQISRLLNTRLKNQKMPLKLCYVGDVLLTKSSELYADRQSTQVGVEIIGCDQEKSNFEIIETILKILPKIAAKNLTIEFSLPNFVELLVAELKIKDQEKMLAAIRKKDLSAVKKLSKEYSDLISEIALYNDNLKLLSAKISAKIKSTKISAELKRAEKISLFIVKNFPQVQLCFDLFGDDRTSYHRDISFDVFCGDFSYPIVRGGRYKINGMDAVGATIYINRLRKSQ